ncbi:MAG: putative serine protease PepD [Actinomycetota bacterium]|jgi:putative serine protease PepD|nr:putative serine protease PepD [Actinomycetota bacterium]MDQ1669592.1 putative serine protease PepD [Actinomycetota bacterium]
MTDAPRPDEPRDQAPPVEERRPDEPQTYAAAGYPAPPAPVGQQPPEQQTPWWSRPAGETWETPAYAAAPPADTERTVWSTPEDFQDTLGSGPRRRRSRAGLLVVAAVVLALLAGGTGGAVGYLLAGRNDGSVTIDGASLGAAPARNVQRPDGSIAGVAAKVLPSVVQIKVETSNGAATGSGFVIDENGFLVTNNHVVAGAQGRVQVVFSDGKNSTAQVVGTSPGYDLAVLKVNATNLAALPLGNSDSVVVGDPVIAIGSPLGLSGTVTSGIISAKNRPVTAGERGSSDNAYINALQTDAAINPGNSGGPLVDLDGAVIGVNSAIATVGSSVLGSEGGNIGVGFAIPINQARRTVEQLINKGEAQFPIIGASLDGSYQGPGAKIATQATNGTPPLVRGGPADKAGMQPGDVITKIDGTAVQDSSELIVAIRSHRPGETVSLTVERNGDERQVRVTLAATKG